MKITRLLLAVFLKSMVKVIGKIMKLKNLFKMISLYEYITKLYVNDSKKNEFVQYKSYRKPKR